jgi:hypothetical protein
MRYLILVGLLAGAAMACQDTAAPRETAEAGYIATVAKAGYRIQLPP